MSTSAAAVGYEAVATLRRVALDGGLPGEAKVSCAGLAEAFDVSSQTVSRRLRQLEAAGLIERDTVYDGQWIAVTDAGEARLREEYQAYRRLFESPTAVDLGGVVTSGMGEGRHYISLPGYMAQFADRLGYEPFPGTLNLELDEESTRRRTGLAAFDSIPIDGWADDERTFGPAACYPATVATPEGDRYEGAHVIAPERTHHDEGQLELIAPDRLRDALNVIDGDRLEVRVEEPDA